MADATRVGKVTEFEKPKADRAPYRANIGGEWVNIYPTIADWDRNTKSFDRSTERDNPALKAVKTAYLEEDGRIVGVTGYEKIPKPYANTKTGEMIQKGPEFNAQDVFEPQPGETHKFDLMGQGGASKPSGGTTEASRATVVAGADEYALAVFTAARVLAPNGNIEAIGDLAVRLLSEAARVRADFRGAGAAGGGASEAASAVEVPF